MRGHRRSSKRLAFAFALISPFLLVAAAAAFQLATRELGVGGLVFFTALAMFSMTTGGLLAASFLRLAPSAVGNLSVVCASLFVSAFIFEGISSIDLGGATTIPLQDTRSRLEVVRDLRAQGVSAYPSAHAQEFIDQPLIVGGKPLIPLSGVSGKTTVYCIEAGPYLIFDADEFGFNNPPNSWKQQVELMFLGDSYTQGACVQSQEHFSGLLRQRHPALLNLGSGGSGPLIQLARLKEFGPLTKPRLVIWFYFEGNDVARECSRAQVPDLTIESKSPILNAYLETGRTQNIVADFSRIDRALKDFVDAKYQELIAKDAVVRTKAPTQEAPSGSIIVRVVEHLTLQGGVGFIRRALGLSQDQAKLDDLNRRVAQGRSNLDLYKRILRQAKQDAQVWGGSLLMVYLPDQCSVLSDTPSPLRQDIRQIWQDEGLPFLDLYDTLRAQKDRKSLFVGHYDARGYRLVAEMIETYLEGRKAP